MNNDRKILVTNDDGINAPGLAALVECMSVYGELTVVAPKTGMSGVGHAITMRSPIIVAESNHFKNISSFEVTGTPADCVKFALGNIYEEMPDMIVSGINHGSNASVNMLYSGTVAAAIEGALYGRKSIAFSSINYDEQADLSVSKMVVHKVVRDFLNFDFPPFTLLNVNIPALSPAEFKGIRFCRQSLAQWKESFREVERNNGTSTFWLTGQFICNDKDETTDIWALENGFASLVPVSLDLTSYDFLNKIKKNIYEKK